MRVLLCDDDDGLRSLLTALLEQRGHEVVGEAEMALTAIELLDRVHPDLAVVDMMLRFGSGQEVVDAAAARGCAVVVFSAYAGPVIGAEAVVEKPDFPGLEAAVEAIAARHTGGERWDPGAPDRRAAAPNGARATTARGIASPEELYATLADADQGDALLRVAALPADAAEEALATITRAVVRAQDVVARVRGEVFVLLVTGGDTGASAVRARLAAAWDPDRVGRPLQIWHEVVGVGDSPSDAFARLRQAEAEPTPTA